MTPTDPGVRDALPCPFCGYKASGVVRVSTAEHAMQCIQYRCDAIGPYRNTEAEAVEAWNRRALSKQEAATPAIDLPEFARLVMENWPHGDVDGGDLQEIAVQCGLLTPQTRTEPCHEGCNCLGYYDPSEWSEGITCYRRAYLKAAQPVSAAPQEPAALTCSACGNPLPPGGCRSGRCNAAPQEPAEPVAGWQLVPIEPTKAMLDKGRHTREQTLLAAWKAMLAVAPTQSVADAQDAGRYRWLRARLVGPVPTVRIQIMERGRYQLRETPKELDYVIDAALDVTKRDPKGKE
jgi:Lar family restriction alleviation protein